MPEADAAVEEERVVGVRRRARDGLRRGVREAIGIADDKLFESITRIKVGGTELFKRTSSRWGYGASRFDRIRDGESQFDARAEKLAQDAAHLGAKLASNPVLRELAVHREVQLATVE